MLKTTHVTVSSDSPPPLVSVKAFPRKFDLDVNAEALQALEESLKQQKKTLIEAKKNKQDMSRNILNEIGGYVQHTVSNKNQVTEETAAMTEEQKEVIQNMDQALEDLRNVEQAFSDVHRKYERAKSILENLKINEEALKCRDETIQEKIYSRDQKLEEFKKETQSRQVITKSIRPVEIRKLDAVCFHRKYNSKL